MVDEGKQKKGFRSVFKRKSKKVDEAVKDVKEVATKAVPVAPKAKATAPVKVEPKKEVVKPVETKEATDTKKKKGSWLSRTKYFNNLSDWAFEVVDTDGSGCVDEKELYSGLLLIHLKLGSFAGPAACKPVERDRVHEIFLKRDADNSGSLDQEEFKGVMSVLCGNIFTRVLAQWSLTLMIVPMLAQKMLDFFGWGIGTGWETLSELDNFEALESTAWAHFDELSEVVTNALPEQVVLFCSRIVSNVTYIVDMIPDSVWSTIPVTLISCILSLIAVPFTILTIDDYFQKMADEKKASERAAV